jgi:hypothetical protein
MFYNGFNLLVDIILVTLAVTITYSFVKETQEDEATK